MKCFICRDGEILGPYSDSELNAQIISDDLIWIPGVEKDWLTQNEWQVQKASIKPKRKKKTPEWYYAIDGKRFGPMTKMDMIDALLNSKSVEKVQLWHKGLDNWKSIFDFKDIVFAIGHENRNNPRVRIKESLILTVEGEDKEVQSIICAGVSLSSEGLGVENLSATLKSGQKVDLSLNFLDADLRIRCKVLSTSPVNKTANLKFSDLQQEAKALVMDFIQQRIEQATQNAA